MSDTRATFMDRALDGEILSSELATALDDAVDAWHESDTTAELSKWLGMDETEYAFFVERPGDIVMVLKARRYGVPLSGLASLRDETSMSIAARSAGGLSRDQIDDLFSWLKRRDRRASH